EVILATVLFTTSPLDNRKIVPYKVEGCSVYLFNTGQRRWPHIDARAPRAPRRERSDGHVLERGRPAPVVMKSRARDRRDRRHQARRSLSRRAGKRNLALIVSA